MCLGYAYVNLFSCNFMTKLQRINWHQENVNVNENEYRFQQVEGLEKYLERLKLQCSVYTVYLLL